jgi:hypothetical protein
MADAAQVLGISKEAVRKRVTRGTLPSDVGEDGRRYVYLDAGQDAGSASASAVSGDSRDELIATLKEQLDAERNAHAETRRIAYTLAQRVPELEASEAPEPRESPPTASEESGRGDMSPEPHHPVERPSWWRKFFGFE